ncbi:MAG: hypothetical protein ACFFE8_10420 [Candidatus Heimdallarchaeota archaeon]
MFSLGIFILFFSLAIISVWLSLLSHKLKKLTLDKAAGLENSLRTRENGRETHSMTSTSRGWVEKQVYGAIIRGSRSKTRDFLNILGGSLIPFFAWIAGLVALLIALGFLFFNFYSPFKVTLIALILATTFVILVGITNILPTIKFSGEISAVALENLTKDDLEVLLRTSYILMIRRRQFFVIAGLLVIYGTLDVIIDSVLIQFMAFFDFLYLAGLTGIARWMNLDQSNPLLVISLILLVGFFGLLLTTVFGRLYLGFCKALIALEVPEDLQVDSFDVIGPVDASDTGVKLKLPKRVFQTLKR